MTTPTPTVIPHPSDPLPPRWHAWRRRRGGKWWIAASGSTESEAFVRMLEATRNEWGHADVVVLPAGDEP